MIIHGKLNVEMRVTIVMMRLISGSNDARVSLWSKKKPILNIPKSNPISE